MRTIMLTALAPALLGAAPASILEVEIDKVRNGRGVIHACLTRNARQFPDCGGDPTALKQTIRAGATQLRLTGFAPGRYALTLFHDENANGRLDTTLGIPREGFGFSRNPVIRFGAPKFSQVGIELKPGLARERVRLQYLL